MSEDARDPGGGLGERVQEARRRAGLTQKELARLSGVSLSLIRKVEQGERPDVRIESVNKLSRALGVTVTGLLGQDPPQPPGREAPDTGLWAPARDAILHPQPGPEREPGTVKGLTQALDGAVRLYHDNGYTKLAAVLPGLVRDAQDAPPLMRSRVLQLAGSAMVQTRNRDAARAALNRSVADAEAAGSDLDAASAIITLCWLLITVGRPG
jgi:transcriptional regulator with XRE-family HTH domain